MGKKRAAKKTFGEEMAEIASARGPRTADYTRSVFINCPSDESYTELFEALVFAVMDCGFHVRCAKDISDASSVRIHKIYELIRGARLSIHDLSRTELDRSTKLPRFNMPLELGIVLGAKYLGDERQRRKECLIFDKQRYQYQKYVSDVAGQDIAAHNNDPRTLVARVRDWLVTVTDASIPGGANLWDRYQRFRSELRATCGRKRQRPEELTFAEYAQYVDRFRRSKHDAIVVSDKARITDPTSVQIRKFLRGMPGGGDSFLIFAKSGSGLTFMQTHGCALEGYLLEHQAGSLDAHFICTNRALSFEEVSQAFVWYAAGDDQWKTKISWEPMELG